MAEQSYYIDLFTPETWAEAGAHGYHVTGFSERRRNYASRIKPGDLFMCYLTGLSRFVGVLRASSTMYWNEERIWASQVFPVRFRCELVLRVREDDGIHLRTVQKRSASPDTYNWIFRASPQEMPADDGEWIVSQLKLVAEQVGSQAKEDPPLTVGAGHPPVEQPTTDITEPGTAPARDHTRIQWRLAKLGRDVGLGVWIARDNKNTEYNGQRLGELSIEELPVSFDRTTQGIIERIDVLWIKRNRIEAAFEIEYSTAIYSGLLRMADLLAMQPTVETELFIVAPESRRHEVRREIVRPSFARLETPLQRKCRYISFARLEAALDHQGEMARYTRPDFLDHIAEPVS